MGTHREQLRAHRKRERDDLKARIHVRRFWGEQIADFLTTQFGSMWFLILNGACFVGWIAINVGIVPGIAIYDPYPFNLLTMAVSLEAIFLATIVLISQNRQGQVAELREKVDVEIDVRAEEEITKVLVILELIADKLQIPLGEDPELKKMEQRTDLLEIEHRIEQDKLR